MRELFLSFLNSLNLSFLSYSNMDIIYEDNHLIAVNKPNRMLVQGDQTGDETLADEVKKYIKVKYEKPGDVFLGIVHRLDRPASGLTIFARTSKALERMNRIFKERQIEKKYWIVVNERPKPLEAHLTHYILKDSQKNVVKAFNTMSRRAKGAKKAELDYTYLGEIGDNHLVEVNLHTGRPHQIRAQMSKAGYPIRGDVKYGYNHKNRSGMIHLHCRSMSFVHPVKKEKITLTANPPDDQIWNLFEFALES